MEERKFAKEMVERLIECDMLNFVIVSTISADALLCAKDCEESIKALTELEGVISEMDCKDKYLPYIRDGLDICRRDLEMFRKMEAKEDKQ